MTGKTPNELLSKCSYYFSIIYYKKIHKFDVDKYEAELDPLKRIKIDPQEVRRFTGRLGCDKKSQVRKDIGKIQSGDWDRQNNNISPHLPTELNNLLFDEQIAQTDIYNSFYQRFENGTAWEKTTYYSVLDKITDYGYEWHGCSNIDEIDNRCRKLDKIYENIKHNGYKPQNELQVYRDILDELSNEIVIDRSRNGEPLLVCGRHRLIMAKILALDPIPMTVAVRHRRWVESN